jgi:hypothetical protein
MKHIRRAFLGLLATIGVLIAAVTPAIAMPVQPPPGPTPADPAAPVTAHGAGLAIWQLALIAAASALVLAVVALAARAASVRTRRRAIASGM